jgi:hypothetical protein
LACSIPTEAPNHVLSSTKQPTIPQAKKKQVVTSGTTTEFKTIAQEQSTPAGRTVTFENTTEQEKHAQVEHHLRSTSKRRVAAAAAAQQQHEGREEEPPQTQQKELAAVMAQLKSLEKAKGNINAQGVNSTKSSRSNMREKCNCW